MSEGKRREGRNRVDRGGREGDEVLPEGRDEAMSTPQNLAGSWRPPLALLQRDNMGAFRCVPNTRFSLVSGFSHGLTKLQKILHENSYQTI